MEILVLGGTGAMGVPTIKRLADKGFDVYVTSRTDHQSANDKIHYIKGNAHDKEFLTALLERRYKAIIDFMIYDTAEFRERYGMLLSATDQYVFLSSARVYAKSDVPITESSPRLLDVVEDEEYKETAEYALEKARQEDILLGSGQSNWTIIRPYITYNNERMQLGAVEKEQWLYRALHGRSIVFSKDIAEKITTLTHGDDVADIITGLIGNPAAKGTVFHAVGSQTIAWQDVLRIYIEVLEKRLGRKVPVFMEDTSDRMSHIRGNKYQVRYDRMYDRIFDNIKVRRAVGKDIEFMPIEEGLNEVLNGFLDGSRRFGSMSWKLEAYFDRVSGEHTLLTEIKGWKNKFRYLVFRYTPYLDRQYRREGDAKDGGKR